LVELGLDINKRNKYSKIPIFYALRSENVNLIKWFVEMGANLNKGNYENETPLFIACSSDNESFFLNIL